MSEFRLKKTVTVIGRDPNCDIVIPNSLTRVSRQHAEIRREGAYFVLYDQSSHGTIVNGEKIERGERKPLGDGDHVSLGGQADYTYQGGSLHGPGKSGPIQVRKKKTPPPPPPPPPPQTNYTPVFLVAGLLIVAVAAIFLLWQSGPSNGTATPTPTPNNPAVIASQVTKSWVSGNTSVTAHQITVASLNWIQLDEPELQDKIAEQIRQKTAWTYDPPKKVTEDIYDVEAIALISLQLVNPFRTYNIKAHYKITVDTGKRGVRTYHLEGVEVTGP